MTMPIGVASSILLVGCGRMGGALLAGWREQGLAPFVVEPSPGADLARMPGISLFASVDAVPGDLRPDIVIAAVKPQMAAATLPRYARFMGNAVLLSIMAGSTTASLRQWVGAEAAIVRAMPNTPAAVRKGITVAYAGRHVSEPQRTLCDALLQAAGLVAWVEDEDLLNPVTAVSGGGPAYVFLLAELLEQAAIGQGIPADLARLLARRTVSGAGALLEAGDEDAAALRQAVTSPRGTTERALAVLMEQSAWPALLDRAIAAATARSRELAL